MGIKDVVKIGISIGISALIISFALNISHGIVNCSETGQQKNPCFSHQVFDAGADSSGDVTAILDSTIMNTVAELPNCNICCDPLDCWDDDDEYVGLMSMQPRHSNKNPMSISSVSDVPAVMTSTSVSASSVSTTTMPISTSSSTSSSK